MRTVVVAQQFHGANVFTDGTGGYNRVELKYNALGQVSERKDNNQSVHDYDYDDLGRLVNDRVTSFGSGRALLRKFYAFDAVDWSSLLFRTSAKHGGCVARSRGPIQLLEPNNSVAAAIANFCQIFLTSVLIQIIWIYSHRNGSILVFPKLPRGRSAVMRIIDDGPLEV